MFFMAHLVLAQGWLGVFIFKCEEVTGIFHIRMFHIFKKILTSVFWGGNGKVWHQGPGSSLTKKGVGSWVAAAPSRQASPPVATVPGVLCVPRPGFCTLCTPAWPLETFGFGNPAS